MKTSFKNLLYATLFIIAVAVAMSPLLVNGQQTVKVADKELKDTVIRDVTYKLYLGSRGGKYYFRTSAKGNIYKVYIQQKKL